MFKWPDGPSPSDPENELADFAELLCWRDGNTSATDLTHFLGRIDENEYSDGIPEEEKIPERVENAFSEIERRAESCRDGYPFLLGNTGDTLHAIPTTSNDRYIIYKYLLLATRLNMKSNRKHAGIDGTHLLEELSAETCLEYFGDRAESMVFGTAAGSPSFRGKINDLCRRIGEGGGFKSRTASQGHERDGKLDVVVWKHFSDGMAGKLIAFGQCKTGTSYRNTLTQLQPDSFCRKWMQDFPTIIPMRMFFLAEALPQATWFNFVSDTGLLFDRCRIVDFSSHISQTLSARIKVWTAGASGASRLPSP